MIKTQKQREEKVLNPNTGELEIATYREIKTHIHLKRGYVRMYPKNYDEATEKIIHSNLDLKIWITIRKSFTRDRVESSLPSKEIAKKLKTSQQKVSGIIKRMVDEDVLRRVSRGIYKLNPFVYMPYMANGEKLQKEWENTNDSK